MGDDDQDGKKKTESVVPPELSHDFSCTCCLNDSSLIFVHTEDNADFSFLSFPSFILTNGLWSWSIMNYLVFSSAAAEKAEEFLSEVKIPALIALNSALLMSWSSAASADGCPEPPEGITGWCRAPALTDAANSLWLPVTLWIIIPSNFSELQWV